MCDNKNNNLNSGVSFVAGAVIGAFIGAAAAVLLNPTTGPETRKKLATSAKKYSEKGDEFSENAKEMVEKVKKTAQPYIKDVAEKTSPYVQNAISKIKENVNIAEDSLYDDGLDSEQIQMLVDQDSVESEKPKKPIQKNRKYFKKTS
jgi:gas vesicle protein